MFILEIASLKIKINNKYQYLEKFCKDYISDSCEFDFEVSANDKDIEDERKSSPSYFKDYHLESLCIYRKIALLLPKYDAYLIHGAALKIDEVAYIILAKSGTGKTTHANNLKSLLGERLSFINGDKPIIRIINNKPYVFGTPWCGKEHLGSNTNSLISSFIFLERGNKNEISEISGKEILPKIIHQIIMPNDLELLDKTINLVNQTLTNVNTYLLKCTKDKDSALETLKIINK